MSIDGKLGPIRKGLLEFLILKIISADKVYVADMLKLLSTTEFATQEGTLYPLLSKMRRPQVLQAHRQGQVAACGTQPILEADQHHDQ
jgi:PadR family transcriptional regulator PadR